MAEGYPEIPLDLCKWALSVINNLIKFKDVEREAFGVISGQEKYTFGQEAQEVAELFGSKPFLDATINTVLENTKNDILHFACHGKFNYFDPLSSGIKLYDDTLKAREIFNLEFNSELTTLSACQTGLSETKPGDELIGLTRSLIYAGAASVIVSLWSVYDPSTRELMVEFYKQGRNYITEADLPMIIDVVLSTCSIEK